MNCEWLLNDADKGEVSSTLTTGHHRELNILAPMGGHKEMGVIVVYEYSD